MASKAERRRRKITLPGGGQIDQRPTQGRRTARNSANAGQGVAFSRFYDRG